MTDAKFACQIELILSMILECEHPVSSGFWLLFMPLKDRNSSGEQIFKTMNLPLKYSLADKCKTYFGDI